MNNSDRKVLAQVASMLRDIHDLYPANPCDIKRVARAAKVGTETARALAMALDSLRYPDEGPEMACEYLEMAREKLAQ